MRPFSPNVLATQSYQKALRDVRATHAIMVFDSIAGDLRRKAISPSFKCNRRKKSARELELMRQFRKSLKLPTMVLKGVDGDDVLFALAKRSPIPTCIITADKDLLVCVNDNTTVYDPMKKKLYKTDADVISHKKIGVPAHQVSWYLALVGDSVDDITGVKGIGPVRAHNILSKVTSRDPEDIWQWLSEDEQVQFDHALALTSLRDVALKMPELASARVRLL